MKDEIKERIYFDYAASTPVRAEVRKVIEPFLADDFGNPSSIHYFGQRARAAIDEARDKVAAILDCSQNEILFTSGGTEADNLAIRGVVANFDKPHIITTALEHQAVYRTCQDLEKQGLIDLTVVKPDKNGVVEVSKIKKAIRPETVLVCVMYVSNEFGTVQPVREIGRMLDKINETRAKRIYLHTDAVQAAGYFLLNVKYLHIDLLTLSGHKIGAPKGAGLLYVKAGTPIGPMLTGGEQESRLRAGTENVSGIVGMAEALELANRQREDETKRLAELRDYWEKEVLRKISQVKIIGKGAERSPAISSLVLADIEAQIMVMNLDLAGVAVSAGAACAAGSLEESAGLKSLDLKKPYLGGAVRFSFGIKTTKEEVDRVSEILSQIVKRLRDK